MVDTTDKSNDIPKATFGYVNEEGDAVETDANAFSNIGKIQFQRILELQDQRNRLIIQIEEADVLINAKKTFIMDNEINKPEENSEVEDAEVVKDDKGDSNGKS